MAHNDVCRIEMVNEINRRSESAGGVKPAIREVAKEYDIPAGTLSRWYWPDGQEKYIGIKNDTAKREQIKKEKRVNSPEPKTTKEPASQNRTAEEQLKQKKKEAYSQKNMSQEFKSAWEELLREIQRAKLSKWETTSKEAALKCANCLIDVITI